MVAKQQKLRKIFNAFAKRAAHDFPHLKDRLVIYSHPTETWHGTLPGAHQMDHIMDDAEDSAARQDAVAFAEHKSQHDIIAYLVAQGRTMTSARETSTQEVHAVLEHELGHLVAPHGNSNRLGDNFCECVADSFSFIRLQKAGISLRAVEAASWTAAANFILDNETVHFTTPVLTALRDFSQRHDLSQLTPIEAANLAYRITRKYAYTPAQIRALQKAFAPVYKDSLKGAGVNLKKVLRVMFCDHGKHSAIVYQTGLAFLQPYLDGRADILAMQMTGAQARKQKPRGRFWTAARKKIATREEQSQARLTDVFNRHLDDLQLLGRFDRSPQKIIRDARYDGKANQRHIKRARMKYAFGL